MDFRACMKWLYEHRLQAGYLALMALCAWRLFIIPW